MGTIKKVQKGTETQSSFQGVTIRTTPQKLIDISKKLEAKYWSGNDGEDKTNFDFEFETSEGIYFTVYDWKEYRKLGLDETITFHIGSQNDYYSQLAKEELQNEL